MNDIEWEDRRTLTSSPALPEWSSTDAAAPLSSPTYICRSIGLIAAVALAVLVSAGAAQSQTSSNYSLESSSFSTSTGEAQSANYTTVAVIGATQPTGDSTSDSFDGGAGGVFDPDDQDFDGVSDADDLCPEESAAGFDADYDGCIDTFSGLIAIIDSLPSEDIGAGQKKSLTTLVQVAQRSLQENNVSAATSQLAAIIIEITALSGVNMSTEAAELLTAYARNIAVFNGLA